MASVDDLLRALGDQVSAGGELARQLGVSQPTLSRLTRAAGSQLMTMGQTRGRTYARTRGVEGVPNPLALFRVDENGQLLNLGQLWLLSRARSALSAQGHTRVFEGLPPFAVDMSPQGFLGRAWAGRLAELGLPPRLPDYTDDHRLVALARRGEDCVGDLVVGEESASRMLANAGALHRPSDWARLAEEAALGQVGSSAAGEQPKFLVREARRQRLVKYAEDDGSPATRRWRELLCAEHLALETLRRAGVEASRSELVDHPHRRYLAVERFDRVGLRGRRGVISLWAYDNEYLGLQQGWAVAARRMADQGLLPPADARALRWLDVFGQLIGNTDRHLGNVSFFTGAGETFTGERVPVRLAPAYDMLPMHWAPVGAQVPHRPFAPAPPTVDTLDVFTEAAEVAAVYWRTLEKESELSRPLRRLAASARLEVSKLASRHHR